MSSKSIKSVWNACLFFGILVCILGCVGVVPSLNLQSDPNGIPVKSIKITMDLDQRQEFFTQLQNFADKHSLKLDLHFNDGEKKGFFAHLSGDAYEVVSTSRSEFPTEMSISFLNNASPPTSQKTFDALVVDLKGFIGKIPTLIIKEKIKNWEITMDKDRKAELFTKLFTQLRNFADQHSFKFIVSSYDPEYKFFVVEMDGNGFQITCESLIGTERAIGLDFYSHVDGNGAPTSTSQKAVDQLLSDLKSSLGEMPNVTITEHP